MVLKKKAHWNWYLFYSFNENIYFKRATLPLCEMSPNTEFFPVRISAFGLNTERLSLRIQSKCGKIRNRKNSVFGHFSRSVRKYTMIRVFSDSYFPMDRITILSLYAKICIRENSHSCIIYALQQQQTFFSEDEYCVRYRNVTLFFSVKILSKGTVSVQSEAENDWKLFQI